MFMALVLELPQPLPSQLYECLFRRKCRYIWTLGVVAIGHGYTTASLPVKRERKRFEPSTLSSRALVKPLSALPNYALNWLAKLSITNEGT